MFSEIFFWFLCTSFCLIMHLLYFFDGRTSISFPSVKLRGCVIILWRNKKNSDCLGLLKNIYINKKTPFFPLLHDCEMQNYFLNVAFQFYVQIFPVFVLFLGEECSVYGKSRGKSQHCCPICPYTSAFSSHVKRHLRIHSGERPYICNICNYQCNQKDNLKSHLRRKHFINLWFPCL